MKTAGSGHALPLGALTSGQRAVLVAACSANALFFFDQTAVVTALPTIQRELGASTVEAQWVISAYLLPLAALMVAAGRLGDVVGRRPLFAAGLVLFGISSLACALAPGIEALIAARVGQGVGAALAVPLSTASVAAVFPEERRGWAIGVLATGGTIFLAIGPLVGGALTDAASWRWVFLVNLPVVALALWFSRSLTGHEASSRRFTDWSGLALLAVALTCLVVALLQSSAWAAAWSAGLGAAGVLLAIAFGLHERRCTTPLIATRLLRAPRLAAALTALAAIQFAILGVTIYLPLYLQHALGYRPLIAGLLFLPAVIATPLLSPTVGRRADILIPRPFVIAGLLLATGGLAFIAVAVDRQELLLIVLALLVFGVSRPLVITPSSSAAIDSLPPDDHGLASGLVTSARQIGSVLGAAVIGATVGGAEGAALSGPLTAGMWVAAGVAFLAAVAAYRWLHPPLERRLGPPCECRICLAEEGCRCITI